MLVDFALIFLLFSTQCVNRFQRFHINIVINWVNKLSELFDKNAIKHERKSSDAKCDGFGNRLVTLCNPGVSLWLWVSASRMGSPSLNRRLFLTDRSRWRSRHFAGNALERLTCRLASPPSRFSIPPRTLQVRQINTTRDRGPVRPDATVHWMGHSLTLTFPPT